MKRLLFTLLILLLFSSIGYGQLGDRFFWQEKIAITIAATDTTFPVLWEVATVYSDTLDLWLRVGAPDVGDWSSRVYFKLESGLTLTIGPTPKLKRLDFKCVNGSGFIYIIGYKKSRQF